MTGDKDKFRVIAEDFCAKMTAPASAEHHRGATVAEMTKDAPLGPYRETLGETYKRVETTGEIKAIDNLPLRRAPGADA